MKHENTATPGPAGCILGRTFTQMRLAEEFWGS